MIGCNHISGIKEFLLGISVIIGLLSEANNQLFNQNYVERVQLISVHSFLDVIFDLDYSAIFVVFYRFNMFWGSLSANANIS